MFFCGSFERCFSVACCATIRRLTLTVGSQVGPYEILSPLGVGGMGEVWKARDTRLNRIVAIKQCKEDFSDRFLREARAIAALNHPNICTLYDVGPDYLVMEYIEGAPPRGPLPPAEATRIALGIAGALAAAHARGITHRDLKPGNVLVTSSGVKLLDFGLATSGDTFDDTEHGTVTRTAANEVVGTIAFMSPEQAQGQPVDSRSDIFSFGAVLYELLSGRPPFQGSSILDTAAAILRDEPSRLDAPPTLAAIVERCLRKSPASRFQTIAELQAALEGVGRDAGVANRAAGPQTDTVQSPASPRLERVTWTAALTGWPALSSDARLIAYVSDGGHDGTTPQIWIQQIGGAALRLTNGDREYSHLSFSPDNTRIFFTASDSAGPNVYEVPALGGEPRLLHRSASRGFMSPDGLGFACVQHDAAGIPISARGAAGVRTVASDMVDVACLTWSPDSRSVLAHARPGHALEPDLWIVPIDGALPINTGVVQRFREAGLYVVPVAAAWVDASLIFSAAGPDGVRLYRQRIDASTFQPVGAPNRLTTGSESAQFPSTASGRLAYVSNRADANLWSVALDGSTGIAHGPLRRMTRGPHPLAYLTVTHDFGTLAYFSFRFGSGDVFLRDLRTGAERVLTDGPEGGKGYPAISPGGGQLAYRLEDAGRTGVAADFHRPLAGRRLAHAGRRLRRTAARMGGRTHAGHRTLRAPELDRVDRLGHRGSARAIAKRRTVDHQSACVAGSSMDRVRGLASG